MRSIAPETHDPGGLEVIEALPRFPCSLDKRPLTARGHLDATSNPIDESRWPLTGVPTGTASGLDVLDVDATEWLDEHYSRLPATRAHETRSGGRHFLFRHAQGLRCSAGRVAPGVDVRADGGYVIWWPRAGLRVLSDAPIAPWPEWLLAIAHKKPTPRVPHVIRHQSQQHGTLVANELPKPLYFAIVRCTPPNAHEQRRVVGIIKDLINCQSLRNNRLNWAGHALREFRLWLSHHVAWRLLEAASQLNGYQEKDGISAVRATIWSALGPREEWKQSCRGKGDG